MIVVRASSVVWCCMVSSERDLLGKEWYKIGVLSGRGVGRMRMISFLLSVVFVKTPDSKRKWTPASPLIASRPDIKSH